MLRRPRLENYCFFAVVRAGRDASGTFPAQHRRSAVFQEREESGAIDAGRANQIGDNWQANFRITRDNQRACGARLCHLDVAAGLAVHSIAKPLKNAN
jgi:hypothetical protein